MSNKKVVCFGEVLWDSLPKGLFLGGAPLNVALNLKHLNVNTTMISAVGNDSHGKEAIKEITEKGLSTDFIQVNNQPTGLVDAEIDSMRNANYTIHAPSACDFINWNHQIQEEVENADYFIFGTLAFRNKNSGTTIQKLLSSYKGKAVVDLNLRAPFYNEMVVDEVLTLAQIAKVNHDELNQILKWKNERLSDEEALLFVSELYNLEIMLLTRGEEGSVLLKEGQFYRKKRFRVKVMDTVGAGDAFLAGAVHSMLNEKSGEEIIAFANAMGAYVASQNGATPNLVKKNIEELLSEK